MVTAAPTRPGTLTGQGVIVGTLQYMAPEQLEGKPADARTDLWALGAMLYEMVTGKRAFEGTSAVSLMAAIMDQEPPPIATLQPLTPPALDRLVRQCFAKLPDDRPDTAHDVANELRWMRETSDAIVGGTPRPSARRLGAALLVALGLLLGATGAIGVLWRFTPVSPLARVSLDVRPADDLNAGGVVPSPWLPTPGGTRTALTWTPDGQAVVFVGRRAGLQQLYVRRL
jgi:eukaryotic-like serine/threonine-protein kinase